MCCDSTAETVTCVPFRVLSEVGHISSSGKVATVVSLWWKESHGMACIGGRWGSTVCGSPVRESRRRAASGVASLLLLKSPMFCVPNYGTFIYLQTIRNVSS
ncbi:hypothetical protein TNCT_163781 [Trichonephila clavata]|uniref:Uncharacterized protein n=1 Tax=Trichonephila clavata TaxID=2740835 RepID=A0A8X6GEK8_TRICU|nr:hypothetical protein TNCT_163781 [Trichonephila clavata]